jgi:hypothetical protein
LQIVPGLTSSAFHPGWVSVFHADGVPMRTISQAHRLFAASILLLLLLLLGGSGLSNPSAALAETYLVPQGRLEVAA